jgi:hypothetical protein
MLFKRINRDSAETVFIVVKNVTAGTLSAGDAVAFDVTAPDGVRVSRPATATLSAFAGVLDQSIAANGYGLCQVYGYRSSAAIYSSTGSSAAGDYLACVNASHGLTPATSSATINGVGFLCEAVAGSSSSRYNTTAKVFLRCL